jgi:hypothetical protein
MRLLLCSSNAGAHRLNQCPQAVLEIDFVNASDGGQISDHKSSALKFAGAEMVCAGLTWACLTGRLRLTKDTHQSAS